MHNIVVSMQKIALHEYIISGVINNNCFNKMKLNHFI